MRANLVRDIDAIPPEIRANIIAFPTAMVAVLDSGWPGGGRVRLRRAAIGHVVAFETWRSLMGEGLTAPEVEELMSDFVTSIG